MYKKWTYMQDSTQKMQIMTKVIQTFYDNNMCGPE